jgi:hypothetical protein
MAAFGGVPRIGVSACLLGQKVRFDGGHKRDHHVRRLGVDYLKGQTYLEPHPRELMLRNHV